MIKANAASIFVFISNIVASMSSVPLEIQTRQIKHFYKADPDYGAAVARGLGLRLDNVLNGARAAAGN